MERKLPGACQTATMQVFDGVQQPGQVWRNLPTPALYEHVVRRHEAMISHLGPMVVRTGQYTGRSPNDKWVVDEPGSADEVWWATSTRRCRRRPTTACEPA